MTRKARTPAAERQRRHYRRLTRDLAVLQVEVHAEKFDDLMSLIHRRAPGAMPRLRLPPGREPTTKERRAEREAFARALIEGATKILTRQDQISDESLSIAFTNRRPIAPRPIMDGDHTDMATSRSAAPAETARTAPHLVSEPPAPQPAAPPAPAVRTGAGVLVPKRPFAPGGDTQPADLKWTSWQHIAPAEYTVEDVLDEQYFRMKVEQMRPGHVIEVRSGDFRFWLRLLVMAVDRTAKVVKTYVLDQKELPGQQVAKLDADMLRIIPLEGPEGQQFIVRYGRNTNVATFASRSQAEKYIAERRDEAA